MVALCHEKGILVAPWTINTVAEMKNFKIMGVDGIITDYPNYFKDLE
jgi:glycerophosphoryl diester phosphodiesterase